jgi:hypothetical protein
MANLEETLIQILYDSGVSRLYVNDTLRSIVSLMRTHNKIGTLSKELEAIDLKKYTSEEEE